MPGHRISRAYGVAHARGVARASGVPRARALLKIKATKIETKYGAFHARGAYASDERALLKGTCLARYRARSTRRSGSSRPPGAAAGGCCGRVALVTGLRARAASASATIGGGALGAPADSQQSAAADCTCKPDGLFSMPTDTSYRGRDDRFC